MPRPAKTQNLQLQQCAALIGVSLSRVQQMVRDGILPKDASHGGGIDCEWFAAWLKDRMARDFGVTESGEVINFDQQRARKMKADADLSEMEAETMRGLLLKADEVEREWTDTLATVRAKLLALPSKLAAQTAPPDLLARVQAVAKRIVDEALTALAEQDQESEE